jgi:hypothetical protein
VDNSLGKNASDAVDSRIAGTDRDVARHLYLSFPSNSNYTDPSETRGGVDEFIRNPDFWAADIDLTCISPAIKPTTTWRRSGTWTLISENIVVSCAHWTPYEIYLSGSDDGTMRDTNHQVCFVTMDNQLVVRTVIKVAKVTGDISIGILDEPILSSSGITPAKILPSNYMDYITIASDIPGLVLDQQEHGMVHEVAVMNSGVSWYFPKDSKRYEFVDV